MLCLYFFLGIYFVCHAHFDDDSEVTMVVVYSGVGSKGGGVG